MSLESSAVLFSFLGTGTYTPTHYAKGPDAVDAVETGFVALSLARLYQVRHVVVFATPEAAERHGAALRESFLAEGRAEPEMVGLPSGRSTAELWEAFETLRGRLAADAHGQVLFDITHGFRAQPFFAAAVIAYLRGLEQGLADLRVVYGAYEARDQATNITPIWDLTAFSELIDWSNALERLVATGDARAVGERALGLGRRLARDWALAGQPGPRPELDRLGNALRDFGDALDTIRVGALLLGFPGCGRGGSGPCAVKLVEAVEASRTTVVAEAPPLAPLLDEVVRMAAPLTVIDGSLDGAAGLRAQAALVRLYLRFGRVAEAAAVLREAWISAYAVAEAACPGDAKRFDKLARAQAETWFWRSEPAALAIAEVRNDVEHAGFRAKALPPKTIRDQLARLLGDLEQAIESGRLPVSAPASTEAPRTYFVSRHPGALEWATEEGIAVDELVLHLDPAQIQPGDTVIGSLPVNLAAEVCARGAEFRHLSLDLPPELRGRELTAEQMRACGARLETFRIERVG